MPEPHPAILPWFASKWPRFSSSRSKLLNDSWTMDKTQNCSLSNAVSENCSRFEGPNQSAHPTVNTCGFPCRSIVQPNERLSLAGDESKLSQLSQQDEWEIRARGAGALQFISAGTCYGRATPLTHLRCSSFWWWVIVYIATLKMIDTSTSLFYISHSRRVESRKSFSLTCGCNQFPSITSIVEDFFFLSSPLFARLPLFVRRNRYRRYCALARPSV